MGDLDLIQYEEPEVDGSADLSMWETAAPIIGSTIAEVNTLASQMEASFPHGELVTGRHASVQAVVQAALGELRSEVMNFGMRVRDPSVVGDRWNLLTELQIFRFRFRDRIGRLVWEIAQAFAEDVKRREVEPGYDDALGTTLLVRSMTADLRRLMRKRIHQVGEATDMLGEAQQMEKELNAFGRTKAWPALRAQDKKGILEFRAKLRALIAGGAPGKIELLELLEPFVEFVDGFAGISQRQILVEHDQEQLANVGLAIERAMNTEGVAARLDAYRQALSLGQSLYGRSTDFDSFLRTHRRATIPPVPEAIAGVLEQFLVQIAQLSQY
ncbi:MAG: hypothetical protein U0228_18915 [Myxococcaceae bacterium]